MKELTGKQVVKRLIIWLVLALILFIAGIFVGYIVVGKGNWHDLFDPQTWYHVIQFWQ